MGIIANYQSIDDISFKRFSRLALKEDPDKLIDEIESLQEEIEDDEILDIDKMWDALHFILTGKDTCFLFDVGNPLSEAVIGKTTFSDLEFISGIDKERVKEIASALEAVDSKLLALSFDMKKMKEYEIYPNIWGFDEESDKILEEILDYLEAMKVFYRKMADRNRNVLVTIY